MKTAYIVVPVTGLHAGLYLGGFNSAIARTLVERALKAKTVFPIFESREQAADFCEVVPYIKYQYLHTPERYVAAVAYEVNSGGEALYEKRIESHRRSQEIVKKNRCSPL